MPRRRITQAQLQHSLAKLASSPPSPVLPPQPAVGPGIEGWSTSAATSLAEKIATSVGSMRVISQLQQRDALLDKAILDFEMLEDDDIITCSEPQTMVKMQQRLARLLKQQQELEAAL